MRPGRGRRSAVGFRIPTADYAGDRFGCSGSFLCACPVCIRSDENDTAESIVQNVSGIPAQDPFVWDGTGTLFPMVGFTDAPAVGRVRKGKGRR